MTSFLTIVVSLKYVVGATAIIIYGHGHGYDTPIIIIWLAGAVPCYSPHDNECESDKSWLLLSLMWSFSSGIPKRINCMHDCHI